MKTLTLLRQGNQLASPAEQRTVLADADRVPGGTFETRLAEQKRVPLTRDALATLQINLGKVCNQTCTHCHVDAGPDRRESMSEEVAGQVIDFLSHSDVETLDITGGAPEMNAQFRRLVEAATCMNKKVIDRCNLTILLANGFTDLPEFLAKHKVNIVASLPCYLEANCDSQRGDGVYEKSIHAIRRLNDLGYGVPGCGLELDLVYNPTGTGLPPEQQALEQEYREQLDTRHGIFFNHLFTITNMPVSRFLSDLLEQNKYEVYMQKLLDSFNPDTVDQLMCRSLVSVDWKGYLFDCDFNQMLDLPILGTTERLHISELTDDLLNDRTISTANHCFGCTAGAGSSCTGNLT
ncbi:molybdenum cofactor biosynthesis protein A [Polystyrenella longa]|uniref:Molybdenum cofactor biosynthesis protein A n=1 Tax=Polystyrenella longa TaxID=2528007 RepID=A0A518CSW4_9PLAN|nr:arsenosugar biosynthesis radical SAM (seleno)protein ArsS [Polystyrenella longa]QDU82295.1 molybdenum cofactor biosynthesis protein A [Polystyrenella longa]